MKDANLFTVIPAKAGIHAVRVLFNWITVFAGMTIGMNCYVLAFSGYECSILVTLLYDHLHHSL